MVEFIRFGAEIERVGIEKREEGRFASVDMVVTTVKLCEIIRECRGDTRVEFTSCTCLRLNMILGRELSMEDTKRISGAISEDCAISDFHLSSGPEYRIRIVGGGMGRGFAEVIASAVAQNHVLTTLELCIVLLNLTSPLDNCNIGVEGAKSIAEMLAQNHTLLSLELRIAKAFPVAKNELGVDEARILANGLRRNQTLTTLDLSILYILATSNRLSKRTIGSTNRGRRPLWTPWLGAAV